MVEGHDSDDEGGQRGNADGEPLEPPPGSGDAGREVSIEQEPGVGIMAADADWIAGRVVEALQVMESGADGHRVSRVSIRLVGDRTMSSAHRRWCDVEGTTDVLTFHEVEADGLHVDLLLCVDEAERRAAEFGHESRRELLLYSVHGVLHCLGHDDHDPAAFERMHAEEDRVLRAIGVGPVYRPGEEDS